MEIFPIEHKKIIRLTIFGHFYLYFIFFFLFQLVKSGDYVNVSAYPFDTNTYYEQDTLISFKYFQRFKLSNDYILLPNENAIYILDNELDYSNHFNYIEFKNGQIYSKVYISNPSDLQYFSIRQYDFSNNINYILLKVVNQYYLLDERGQSIITSFAIGLPKQNNIIIPYFISNGENGNKLHFEFFTGYINQNEYYILHYKCNINDNLSINANQYSSKLLDSNNKTYNFQTDYIPCEYIKNENQDYRLVCFFNGNNELTTIIFDPSNQFNEESKITIKNINAKYIKTAISEEHKKILVCYMEDNSGAVYCLIYDALTQKFDEKKIYFSKSKVSFYQFDVFYEKIRREYIIQTNKNNLEMQIVILNENFENTIYDGENECLILFTIPDCQSVYVSYLIAKKNNNDLGEQENKYFVMNTCQKDGDVFKQNELIINCSEIIDRTVINTTNITNITNTTDIDNITNITNSTTDDNDISVIVNDDNKEKIIEYNFEEGEEVYKAKTNKSIEEVIENLENIVEDIEIGKNYEIKGDDFEIKIHPINNNTDQNITNIDFLECENILREKYGLSENSILTILQIEIESNNDKSLTNQVEYAIYDENKNKLDLSYCSDVKIKVNYEIKDSSILNSSLIDSFSNLGVDILNIYDDFFNDVCFPYSENISHTDVILKDRVKDIYQNYSICDSNCQYENINTETNLIECSCNVKTNITSENETNFAEMVWMTFKNTNFEIIKCYKLVFSSEGISGNYGFYIFLILIIGHIPLITYYFLYGINSMKLFIFKEMQNKNFFPNLSNPVHKKKSELQEEKKQTDSLDGNSFRNNRKRKKTSMIQSRNDIENNQLSLNKIQKNISGSNLLLNSKNEEVSDLEKKRASKKTNENFDSPAAKYPISLKSDTKRRYNIIKKVDFEEPNYPGYYNLIRINGFSNKFKIPESKHILTNYDFKEAINNDIRGFWRILLICLFYKQAILNTFFFKSDLEIKALRIIHFIFGYSLDFALNAFFYFNNKVSDRYNYEGESLYLYSLVNNMIISFCSTLVSFILRLCCKKLINSNKKIENVFREEERRIKRDKNKNKVSRISEIIKEEIFTKIIGIIKILKIKILIFIIFEFILMLFFAYYITAFCAVYKSTQSSWFSDSVVSFIMSNLMDIFISFIISILYTVSINYRIEILYNISIFIYDLGH